MYLRGMFLCYLKYFLKLLVCEQNMRIYVCHAILESHYIVHVNVKLEALLYKKLYRAFSHLHFGARLFPLCKVSKVGINVVLGVIRPISMLL